MIDLPRMMLSAVESLIDKNGVYPHQMIVERKDGTVEMNSLDLSPYQVYEYAKSKASDPETSRMVFGLDRFCRDGQGTTLGDCVGCLIFDGERWDTFIVEYQNEPRVVKPIDYGNEFWNAALRREAKDLFEMEAVK